MNAITIRKLPDGVKQRLRMRAAVHGRSMEAEAREILVDALSNTSRADLSWIEQLMEIGDRMGGVDLEIPEDQPAAVAEFAPSDQ
jgi:plasmid stability protein